MSFKDKLRQQTEQAGAAAREVAGQAREVAGQAKSKLDESGVVDKVKDQAATASAATKERLGDFQVRHNSDPLLRDLGVAVYVQTNGLATDDTAGCIDRLLAALRRIEAEQGPIELEYRTNPGRGLGD
jgi:hypothetical protein